MVPCPPLRNTAAYSPDFSSARGRVACIAAQAAGMRLTLSAEPERGSIGPTPPRGEATCTS